MPKMSFSPINLFMSTYFITNLCIKPLLCIILMPNLNSCLELYTISLSLSKHKFLSMLFYNIINFVLYLTGNLLELSLMHQGSYPNCPNPSQTVPDPQYPSLLAGSLNPYWTSWSRVIQPRLFLHHPVATSCAYYCCSFIL
jgi:hypothetical protein